MSASPKPETRTLALVALLVGVVGIGFAPVFAKLAVDLDRPLAGEGGLSPVAVAFWRTLLATPLLLGFLLAEPRRRAEFFSLPGLGSAEWVKLALPGVVFAIDLSLWHWAFEFTSVANATLEANLAVIFVTLIGWLRLGEPMTPLFAVGGLTALGGMAWLIGFSFDLAGGQWRGDLLGLITAFAYTTYLISTKQLVGRYGALLVITVSTATAALCLLVFAAITPGAILPTTTDGWLMVAGLALASQVAGQGLITTGLARLPASFSAVTLLFQPVVAAASGWIILGQALSRTEICAALVIVLGIALAKRASLGAEIARRR